MEVKVSNETKESIDVEINSVTLAELLRVYLNENGAKLAVWRREHPYKSPVLHVEGTNPKKLIQKAIELITKDLDRTIDEVKKLK